MPYKALTFTDKNQLPTSAEIDKGDVKKKQWKPTPEERDVLVRVLQRIEQEMLPAQQPFHKEWDEAKKIYECMITPDPLRETFRVPISHMIIDAALAEEIDAFPDIAIDSQDPQDKQKLPFLNAAKDYALIRTNWDKVKMEALRIRRIYGFCPVRIYYRRETRKIRQRVPVMGDMGMTIGYEEVMDYPYDDIWLEVIDNPRRFLIGDVERDIDEAGDCALMTEVDWDSYRQKVQYDLRYKNIDCVSPQPSYGTDLKGESTIPEQTENRHSKVKIYEYWNKFTDEYVVIANGVIIRETALVDDHKELPFAILHMYRRPHTFYSKGIPKLIESIEAAYNAVMQAEVRATKLAFPIIVTSDDNVIDPRKIASYPGVVLEGGLDNMDLKPLGSVPNEVYRLKDKLEENLIWLTGINFKQIFQQDAVTNQRVGIEALKKESMLARVNANLRENEAGFSIRLGNLMVQDIMQYFPVPKIRRLTPGEQVDEDDNEGLIYDQGKVTAVLELRKIPVEGMQLKEIANKEKGLFSLKLDSEEGRSFILARPDYIRCKSKLDIHAVRPSAMGSSKEAKKLMLLELSAHAIEVNQAAMMQNATQGEIDPATGQPSQTPGAPIWDLEYLEEQIAEANELDVKEALLSKQENDESEGMASLKNLAAMFSQPVEYPPRPMMATDLAMQPQASMGQQQQPMPQTL